MVYLNEDTVEQAALEWLAGLGYGVRFGARRRASVKNGARSNSL